MSKLSRDEKERTFYAGGSEMLVYLKQAKEAIEFFEVDLKRLKQGLLGIQHDMHSLTGCLVEAGLVKFEDVFEQEQPKKHHRKRR